MPADNTCDECKIYKNFCGVYHLLLYIEHGLVEKLKWACLPLNIVKYFQSKLTIIHHGISPTLAVQLIMLNVNDYSTISTQTVLYHLLSCFVTSWWRVFITYKQAEKQALSRFTGAPSHITNMWEYVFRSKISGLPLRPWQSSLFLSANMQTNTWIKGHALPSKYCILEGEQRYSCTHRYVARVCMSMPVHFCAYFSFPFFSADGADQPIQLQCNTYLPWEQNRALAVLLLSITSSVLHK